MSILLGITEFIYVVFSYRLTFSNEDHDAPGEPLRAKGDWWGESAFPLETIENDRD